MTESLRHRGPDDDGHFEDAVASLGFRRLSIIDLEHGSQPMSMDDGKLQIVYNGEVYNFRELRDRAGGCGTRLPHDLRHRGGAPRVRGVGDRLLPPFQRHVGSRDSRRACTGAEAGARARPLRDQAPLLRASPRPGRLRVGDQGDPPGRDLPARGRRAADVRIPSFRSLRPQRRNVLSRHPPGPRSGIRGHRRRHDLRVGVLDPAAVRGRRCEPGSVSRDLRACRAAAPGGRCSRRHLPERRTRLVIHLHGDGPATPRSRSRHRVAR